MGRSSLKPKLTSSELVRKMHDEKGILFNITTEIAAKKYLLNINNYLRTAAYRKNYTKRQMGTEKGKYIDLEFAYLQELSSIDLRFRSIVYRMCIDIEHSLKVQLLKKIEQDSSDDGYSLVKTFLGTNKWVIKNIEQTITSPFTKELLKKYFTIKNKYNKCTGRNENHITNYKKCPVWVLMEVLSFGNFISFYNYYFRNKQIKPFLSASLLNIIRNLRNACAHNNCMLINLSNKTSNPPAEIGIFVSKIKNIGQDQRKWKLSCRPTMEFITLLYVYNKTVPHSIAKDRIKELKFLFFKRMMKNWRFFIKNEPIRSSYFFACKILSHLY